MDRRQEPCVYGAGKGLEVPEAVKQKAGPGVVGLVAQDGAAGDDGGDAHQLQADRSGLPGAGGSVGHGEQLGEGQQVAGQGHDQAPDPVWPQTPARESGQARCPWHSGYGPRSGPAAGGAPRDRRADPPSCWWRRRWAGGPRRPRSVAGCPGGAALGARLTRIPSGQAVRSAGLSDVRTLPGLAVSVVGWHPGGLGDGARGFAACGLAA